LSGKHPRHHAAGLRLAQAAARAGAAPSDDLSLSNWREAHERIGDVPVVRFCSNGVQPLAMRALEVASL
jgi:hypothetical protein